MFNWVLISSIHESMGDAKAAVNLLKEVFSAKCHGLAPRPIRGLVFATNSNISTDDQETLGIIPFH
jgi:hypothetical protein